MHVEAKFASWIQSLNSNLDVARGNSHLGVRLEPRNQQPSRVNVVTCFFCLLGPWGKNRFEIWMIQPPNQGSSFLVHMYRKFWLRLNLASICTISIMKRQKGVAHIIILTIPMLPCCWKHRHHCATGVRWTFQHLRSLGCPKCSNIFRDFTGQASLISLRSNQNYILLGQKCCSSFFLWMHRTMKEKNNSKKTESNLRIR